MVGNVVLFLSVIPYRQTSCGMDGPSRAEYRHRLGIGRRNRVALFSRNGMPDCVAACSCRDENKMVGENRQSGKCRTGVGISLLHCLSLHDLPPDVSQYSTKNSAL